MIYDAGGMSRERGRGGRRGEREGGKEAGKEDEEWLEAVVQKKINFKDCRFEDGSSD